MLFSRRAGRRRRAGNGFLLELRGSVLFVTTLNHGSTDSTAESTTHAVVVEHFGCLNNTIKLRSGRYLDLADPRADQFDLGDIAAGLSNICRFAGQCPQFYSVAEHSVRCAAQAGADGLSIDAQVALLLHDAAEAFLGDVVKPLKIMLPGYQVIERRMERCIGDKFRIDFDAHAAVIKEIDHAMLIAERRSIFGADGQAWVGENDVRRLEISVHYWSPAIGEYWFIEVATSLGLLVNGRRP